MIKATIEKSNVTCVIEGMGFQIMSELTSLVDSVLDKIVDEDEHFKKEAVNVFCDCLYHIN